MYGKRSRNYNAHPHVQLLGMPEQRNAACNEITFAAEYSAKDVILYALSIGFSLDDLRFVHENDPNFSVAPTFALALMFHAHMDGDEQLRTLIPQFPPPMMRYMGMIPRSSLVDSLHNVDEYPALHTFQSITWHQELPVPPSQSSRRSALHRRFVAVQASRVGTFVTSETTLLDRPTPPTTPMHDVVLCTMLSTTLLLGLDACHVIQFGSVETAKSLVDQSVLLADTSVTIHENAALLYRIAGGDSNRIHVDASPFGKPILHGLCTLGLVSRLLLQKYKDVRLTHLAGRFVKPIFVGSVLQIRVWGTHAGSNDVSFVVLDKDSGEVKVSHGRATMTASSRPKL
jgi:acyl dehydratase